MNSQQDNQLWSYVLFYPIILLYFKSYLHLFFEEQSFPSNQIYYMTIYKIIHLNHMTQ